jgi:hypothetical protein
VALFSHLSSGYTFFPARKPGRSFFTNKNQGLDSMDAVIVGGTFVALVIGLYIFSRTKAGKKFFDE